MTTSIALNHGKVAIVDDVDADLAALKWRAGNSPYCKTLYAQRSDDRGDGVWTTRYLHKLIAARMGIAGQVDHRDRDGLNCTRGNLRAATHQQNAANQGLRKNNTSGVKGVTWDKARGQWKAFFMVGRKRRHLGRYADLETARAVVEAARQSACGEFACHGEVDPTSTPDKKESPGAPIGEARLACKCRWEEGDPECPVHGGVRPGLRPARLESDDELRAKFIKRMVGLGYDVNDQDAFDVLHMVTLHLEADRRSR